MAVAKYDALFKLMKKDVLDAANVRGCAVEMPSPWDRPSGKRDETGNKYPRFAV